MALGPVPAMMESLASSPSSSSSSASPRNRHHHRRLRLSTLSFSTFLLLAGLFALASCDRGRGSSSDRRGHGGVSPNRNGYTSYSRRIALRGKKISLTLPSSFSSSSSSSSSSSLKQGSETSSSATTSGTYVLPSSRRRINNYDASSESSRSQDSSSYSSSINNNPYRLRAASLSPEPQTSSSAQTRSSSSSRSRSRSRSRATPTHRGGSTYRATPSHARGRQSRSGDYNGYQRGAGRGSSRGGDSSRNLATRDTSSRSHRSGSSSSSSSSSSSTSSRHSTSYRRKTVRSSRPNIVLIMTDDQDVLLGSLKYMPKLANLMTRQGAFFNNSFVSTPMCCPSRSTFLTGMYVHNHNVYTNNYNCSSLQWRHQYESRSFATYINATHNTGYFGKYLNEYNGSHVPAGWRRWVGLIKNSRFYNYSVVNERGQVSRHEDNYYKDYLTDLVANDSCSFLLESKKTQPDKPVMMVLSVPAPHGPEDAAPQYQHMFANNTDHRTPAWNYAPNPDKQWLLEKMYKLIPQHKIFTDLLQRRRLQTLQSVDDLVEKVVDQLEMLGELSNTYIIYTSDHGYHLGQYGIIKGKGLPYDFDVRVPLIVRGPGIVPGTVISNLVHNIDLAPTIVDMAGGSVPDHMDGQSFLRLIKASRDKNNLDDQGFVTHRKPWRDTVLLERGKLTERAMKKKMQTEEQIIYNRVSDKRMHFYIPPRKRRLAMECSKESNRLPCKPQQKWYCIEDNGRLRKHKCKNNRLSSPDGSKVTIQKDQPQSTKPCPCPSKWGWKPGKEKRRQRRFWKRHAKADQRAKFHRMKRSVQDGMMNFGTGTVSSQPSGGGAGNVVPGGFESLFNRRCRILSNQSVLCDLDIYQKTKEWQSHKERIDDMIKEYRKALEDLRDIRRHLRRQKPLDSVNGEADDILGIEDLSGKPDTSKMCQCDETGRVISEPPKRRRTKFDKASKKKLRRRRKKKQQTCNNLNMSCFTHNNHHWKTPPYWTYGPFCFCSNSNNNTYWCLRTINQTHNFLYCEFITTFMSFYDLNADPFQLKNIVTELNYGILQQLHEQLQKLKHCKGAKECMMRSGQKNRLPHDPQWAGLIHLKRSKPGNDPYRDLLFQEDEERDSDREDGRRRYTSRHHKERRNRKFA